AMVASRIGAVGHLGRTPKAAGSRRFLATGALTSGTKVNRSTDAQGTERLGVPTGRGSLKTTLGLWRPQSAETGRAIPQAEHHRQERSGPRLQRVRAALPAPREYLLA